MEIGSLLIVGVIVSTLVQIIKNKFGTSSNITLAIVISLSLLSGGVYFFVKDTVFYESALTILAFAGATYTFFIQKFEDKTEL